MKQSKTEGMKVQEARKNSYISNGLADYVASGNLLR